MNTQDRVRLARSERTPMEGAKLIGPSDPHEKMEVTVYLRRGSESGTYPNIARLGSLPVNERHHLSREEFAKAHGASADDLAKVRRFAAEFGLEVKEENPARRSVVLAGTVEAFSRAFETTLERYEHPTKGYYRGRTGTLTIPAELASAIEGVFGLDNRPQAKPHFRIRPEATGKLQPHAQHTSYDPTQVAQAYDFPTGVAGSNQSIALIELGGGFKSADLTAFFRKLKLSTPKVTAIGVDGGANTPTGDPSGPDGEVELDIEVAGSIAPDAQIGVYFAPNTDQGFLDALTTAIHDASLKPSVISISWGGAENTWTQQAMNAFDSAAQDAATMGITIFVASGDNGATDGDPHGNLEVDFPASCPHMTGCGGTKLVLSAVTIKSEVAWNELSEQEGATGGGVSQVFPLPPWQQNANVPLAPNRQTGRGVPDVAGDADPTSGYNVVVDGSGTVIGGTSAVAPLWAGLTALFNQSLGQPIGFLNPLLYSHGTAATFHDIVSGNNGGYTSGPGWDPCTGLGSPDGKKLLTAIGGKPASQQNRKSVAR
jgi:kumamolisin